MTFMKVSLRTWIFSCLLSVALGAEQPLVLPGGGYVVDLEGTTPSVSDFEDFLALAKAFNARKGDAHYTPYADLTCDGTIDFSDFLIFWGRVRPRDFRKTPSGHSELGSDRKTAL